LGINIYEFATKLLKGSSHVARVTYNILNKNSSPTTSAHKYSSIDLPTPRMLLTFSIKSPNLAIVAHV
jgi:hypothetical protein